MPLALGFALFQLGVPLGIVNFVAVGTGASILGSLGAAALGYGATLVSNLLNKPSVPTAEDGKYNLKQNVPPLARIYGTVKKGGDYALLEEKDGVAWHIIVHAGHRIEAYRQIYLHDDAVTVIGGIVTEPAHYNPYVAIDSRVGEDASTAYGAVVAAFPDIWTTDHRGDGLATILMACGSVASEDLQTVYPNGMPVLTAEIDGALLYDPRDEGTRFSRNLALIRADHLMHPSGGAKLGFDDLYWPDWAHAANVCDEFVNDRDGNPVRRYHGGLWYRYSDNQVEVGRLIDQAAELVIYERPDGKVGVHAGEYVEPDVRLTAADILSVRFDPNKRRGSTVLAVRGRYTDPAQGYNTVDAALYGDPYVAEDTERSKTLTNQAVQAHNHMARLEKIAFTRANAASVTLTARYEAARNVPYRRFIRVHLPPKLSETVLEIVGRPVLSLKNLTYTFDAIVVPETLFAFNSATEEGAPGSFVTPIARGTTPVPSGFDVTVGSVDIGGGNRAPYGAASWAPMLSMLTVEVEWQQVSGGSSASVTARPGESAVDTGYLIEGATYRFRARAWAPGGRASLWTDYVTRTVSTGTPGMLDFSRADNSGLLGII